MSDSESPGSRGQQGIDRGDDADPRAVNPEAEAIRRASGLPDPDDDPRGYLVALHEHDPAGFKETFPGMTFSEVLRRWDEHERREGKRRRPRRESAPESRRGKYSTKRTLEAFTDLQRREDLDLELAYWADGEEHRELTQALEWSCTPVPWRPGEVRSCELVSVSMGVTLRQAQEWNLRLRSIAERGALAIRESLRSLRSDWVRRERWERTFYGAQRRQEIIDALSMLADGVDLDTTSEALSIERPAEVVRLLVDTERMRTAHLRPFNEHHVKRTEEYEILPDGTRRLRAVQLEREGRRVRNSPRTPPELQGKRKLTDCARIVVELCDRASDWDEEFDRIHREARQWCKHCGAPLIGYAPRREYGSEQCVNAAKKERLSERTPTS